MSSRKFQIDDLAYFGGAPAFNERLHVGSPNIGDRRNLLNRINDVLDRGRVTNNGPLVRALEQQLAEYLNVKHVIAMVNGTVALEIAIRALDLSGEVILPSMTFVATAHALQWQQIKPVFCDVDPETMLIDPGGIEPLITPLTTGIIGVHLWGRSCDVNSLETIARRNGLKLMFDAAHAFGCSYKGARIGRFGDLEVLSFHATKFFNTFEGGAVATNNDAVAEKMRLMRNFGFSGKDNVIYIGTNGKMNEISAAMGLTSLEHIDTFIAHNRDNYHYYKEMLADVAGVRLQPYDPLEKSNYQYIVIEVDERITRLSRDTLMQLLHAENVVARRYFYPGCHRMEPYRSFQPHAGLLLPQTERLVDRVLTLPTGMAVDRQQIETITALIRFMIDHADAINQRCIIGAPERVAV